MGDLSAHFSTREFRCRKNGKPCPYCVGKADIDDRLIDRLESIREFAGLPIQITSGYRCAKRNAELPDSSPNSAHLTGEAADFFVAGNIDRFKFIEALVWTETSRYGVGPDFIHVDVSLTMPQEVAWTYKGKP